MILEAAPLQVRAGHEAAFEAAFREARRVVAAMPAMVSHDEAVAVMGAH